MRPHLNGEPITIFKLRDDAEMHEFRNRPKFRENSFEELITLQGQVYLHSEGKLSDRAEVPYTVGAGYILLRTSDIERSISLPTQNEWLKFRVRLDNVADTLYEIYEICPLSYHKRTGGWLLQRVLFREIDENETSNGVETPMEMEVQQVSTVFTEVEVDF